MSISKSTILIFIISATSLFPQDKRIHFSVDILGCFSFSPNQGIHDSFSSADCAWFNNTTTGTDIELRVKVKLPLGFHPYFGYHYSRFFESNKGSFLWKNIYHLDFINDYHITKDRINTRSIGANIGLLYELFWLKSPGDIYLILDYRTEHLRSETEIEGYGFSNQSNQDEEFKGCSDLGTKENEAFGLGVGVSIPISIFNFLLELKYVYAWNDIIKRENPFKWDNIVYSGIKTAQAHPTVQYEYLKILIGISIPLFKI